MAQKNLAYWKHNSPILTTAGAATLHQFDSTPPLPPETDGCQQRQKGKMCLNYSAHFCLFLHPPSDPWKATQKGMWLFGWKSFPIPGLEWDGRIRWAEREMRAVSCLSESQYTIFPTVADGAGEDYGRRGRKVDTFCNTSVYFWIYCQHKLLSFLLKKFLWANIIWLRCTVPKYEANKCNNVQYSRYA